MLNKKDRIIGQIETVDKNGTGIFYDKKDKILVKNVLEKEIVEVEVVKKIKEGYFCKLIKVKKPSEYRMKIKCPHFARCGSCTYLHVNYEEQLKLKKRNIISLINKSKLKNIYVHDVVGMDSPYQYRNKIIISFSKKKKEWIAGFYEENTHRVTPIKSCLLHEDYVNDLVSDLIQITKRCRMEPYDEDKGYGYLRHILIRRGFVSNETMVVLVGCSKIFKAKNQFIKLLKEKHPEINTCVLNVNSRHSSIVLGEEEYVLYGKGKIEDTLCNKTFDISSRSFYQINHEQCEKLYDKALSLLNLKGNETLLDAYSGIGTIGIIASNKVKKVYSVEINKDAVKDAINNCKKNNIKNVTCICADAGEFMVEKAKQNEKIDVVIMDPAREGSDIPFLSSVVKLHPKQVVYISCNPETQIRDIEYLVKCGYVVKDMYLYDLFPHTNHVESVCLLSKKSRFKQKLE